MNLPVYLTIDGQRLTAQMWSKRSGISAYTIMARLRRGWSDKDAVWKPAIPGRQKKPC